MQKLITPEKLGQAGVSRKACVDCELHENELCDVPFLKPYVPKYWTGKFLIVADVNEQFERSQYFEFPAYLKKIFKTYQFSRDDFAFMPVTRCRSKKPSMKQIRACAPFVYSVIQQIKPQYIVCHGKNAAKSLLNKANIGSIAHLRGRKLNVIIQDVGYPYFVTYGISEGKLDPNTRLLIAEDWRRFTLEETKLPTKATPKDTRYIGFDTEYTPSQVLCGAFADRNNSITLPASQFKHAQVLLEDSILVGHSVSNDIDSLLKCNVSTLRKACERWLQGLRQRDSLLVARLANENRGKDGYKLESLLLGRHNMPGWKKETEDLGPDPSKWPPALRDERCRIDAWAALKVYDAFKDNTHGPVQMVHQIAMTVARMKHIGVYIDWPGYCKLKKEIYHEADVAETKFKKYARQYDLKDFCPTKDAHIRHLLYDKMGLEPDSYTKGGLPTTSVKKLKEFESEYAEIRALINFSKAEKLRSTYCNSLEQCFVRVKDGVWLAVNINPLAARTGRRSSNKPNMQNLPTRIRKIIVSRFKGGVIADNDYSKLEPILGGWVTGEEKLTEYFTKYPNGYIKIGEDFFKKTVEKNTKEYTMMKSLVLAILYMKKKWSLAEDLWVTHGVKLNHNYEEHVEESGRILDRFLDKLFPRVRAYHQSQEEKVLTLGYVDNAVGQRRHLPLPPEPSRSDKFQYKMWLRYKSHVINQAVNSPIQSLASYVIGSAMIDLEHELLRQYNWTYYDFHKAILARDWPHMPLLAIEVHDDLVQDIPKGQEKKTKELTHEVMIAIPSLKKILPSLDVKLSVDTNVGVTWGLK